jgi:hypothetical protein
MNAVLRVLCAFFLVATASAWAGPTVGGRDFDQWMSYYYLRPAPDEVAEALRTVDSEGYFQNDDVQAPLTGFFAEVFRANPARISEWVKPYERREGLHILYSALWIADSSQSKAALLSLQTAASVSEGPLIESLLSNSPPSINDTAVNGPAVLDYLWGRFMASGADEPVVRVIREIQLSGPSGGTMQMLISGAAKWSVAANARQHARVLVILKAQARALATAPVAPVLQQIIDNTPLQGPATHGG